MTILEEEKPQTASTVGTNIPSSISSSGVGPVNLKTSVTAASAAAALSGSSPSTHLTSNDSGINNNTGAKNHIINSMISNVADRYITPEYLAPEMISHAGHDKTVDWWSVGILIYEMLIGVTPFFNKNRQVLMSKIKHSRIVFPDRRQYRISYSDEVVDLISKLLKKTKEERLGASSDAAEILAHPWFADLDLTALENFELPAPIIPGGVGRGSEIAT